jgi:hypothetical protein
LIAVCTQRARPITFRPVPGAGLRFFVTFSAESSSCAPLPPEQSSSLYGGGKVARPSCVALRRSTQHPRLPRIYASRAERISRAPLALHRAQATESKMQNRLGIDPDRQSERVIFHSECTRALSYAGGFNVTLQH